MATHVFVGPTISRASIQSAHGGSGIHDPIKHGDLLRLNLSERDVVIIVDGLYHHHAPVRHKEILDCLSKGVSVIGAASMGALRAAELHPYGMVGIGKVFDMYRGGKIESDDEIAVAHSMDPDWRVLTNALVDIRHVLNICLARREISPEAAEDILDMALALPYSQRSWGAVEAMSRTRHNGRTDEIRTVRRFVSRHPERSSIKRIDALAAVKYAANIDDRRYRRGVWFDSRSWRNVYLRRWIQEFSGEMVDGLHVSRKYQRNHLQIYAADFPRYWRRMVLGKVARCEDWARYGDRELEDAALERVAASGLSYASLSDAQCRAWLTDDERTNMDARSAMLTVLVRSTRPHITDNDDAVMGSLAGAESTQQIVDSQRFNDLVAKTGSVRQIEHIRHDKIAAHLSDEWSLSSGGDVLSAAARDRGFASVTDAVEAARPFFLLRFHNSTLARQGAML
jgi:hypothetical protein